MCAPRRAAERRGVYMRLACMCGVACICRECVCTQCVCVSVVCMCAPLRACVRRCVHVCAAACMCAPLVHVCAARACVRRRRGLGSLTLTLTLLVCICTPSGAVRRAYARPSPCHSQGDLASYACRQCRIRRSRPHARRAAPFGVHMHISSHRRSHTAPAFICAPGLGALCVCTPHVLTGRPYTRHITTYPKPSCVCGSASICSPVRSDAGARQSSPYARPVVPCGVHMLAHRHARLCTPHVALATQTALNC